MLESNAKLKICAGPEACGLTVGQDRMCAGSSCMAWEWSDVTDAPVAIGGATYVSESDTDGDCSYLRGKRKWVS